MDPSYPNQGPPPGIGFEMHNVEVGMPSGVGPQPPPEALYPPVPSETHRDRAVTIGFEGHTGDNESVPRGVDNAGYVDDGPVRKGRLDTDVTDKGRSADSGAGISLLGYKPVTDQGNGQSAAVGNDAYNTKGSEDKTGLLTAAVEDGLPDNVDISGPDDTSEEHRLVDSSTNKSFHNNAVSQRSKKTMFFNDGKRRIDYILAYVPDGNADKARKRDFYLETLKGQGLELEEADRSQSKDGKTTFVKVHAPWDVLVKYAELLHMKMPLAENDMEDNIRSLWDMCCSKLPNPFELDETVVKPEPSYFTAVFNRNRIDQYIVGDEDSFFPNAQRSRIVNWILGRANYEEAPAGKCKFGIKRLINNGTFSAAYPLHEGDFSSDHSIYAQGPDNERHLLYEVWARPKNFYKYQPLDLIRKYFGEKIGIYFCWLGFYTTMLIPAAIVGLAVFLYGVATAWSDPTSIEICDEKLAGNITMCPNCDRRCPYWKLKDSCIYSRVSYFFDNEATVAFAFFMALWAVVFLEFWKRKQAEIGYDWDVNDYEEEEETVRPEFETSVTRRRMNPVYKSEEPYVPIWSKLLRYLTALFVVVFMLAIVIAGLFGVILYRIAIVALLHSFGDPFIRGRASLITTATAALISLVLIIVLGFFYQFIARWLTNMEQHRTDTEWEDSFTLKMFLFQFLNYYGTIFYIAFFKGRFLGRPGDYDYSLSSERQEECDPAGCLIELCIQLAIVMVGKQTFNNFKEIILPKIVVWFKSRKIIDKDKDVEERDATRWEKDYCLANMPNYGLFEEYLEMVIQYGFVTIFVAAFPLAPLCALLNNIVEIRLDAYKFCTQWKRPFAQRAEDIGIWFSILRGVTAVAVISNAFIIAITSDFIPKLVYKYEVSPDRSLNNYINNSLSYFDTSHFQPGSVPEEGDPEPMCRYRAYRENPWETNSPDYKYTRLYWHIIAAKFAFVIVFENLIVFLSYLISYLIPDIPHGVKIQMLREQHLAGQAILEASRVEDEKRKVNKQD